MTLILYNNLTYVIPNITKYSYLINFSTNLYIMYGKHEEPIPEETLNSIVYELI